MNPLIAFSEDLTLGPLNSWEALIASFSIFLKYIMSLLGVEKQLLY